MSDVTLTLYVQRRPRWATRPRPTRGCTAIVIGDDVALSSPECHVTLYVVAIVGVTVKEYSPVAFVVVLVSALAVASPLTCSLSVTVWPLALLESWPVRRTELTPYVIAVELAESVA